MNWDDNGFLLSKNRYNENSLISEVFTKDHGKVPGIIFGGTSKKIKSYLQIGNNIHINFNSKSGNSIGYFKIEICKALSPHYFDNPQKLSCISSAMQLVKILTPDFQTNNEIYHLIKKFYVLLENENWIKNYIFWELELLKILGYDLVFKNMVDKEIVDNKFRYISKSVKERKIIPNFLIEKNHDFVEIEVLLSGLKIVGDYLDKTILRPNNLTQPASRLQFISSLK